MGVKRNVQFTKLIKACGHLREFNFRKSHGKAGTVFNVDVPDDKVSRYYLVFNQDGNQEWDLENNNLPSWLLDALPQIKLAITESEKNL